jgi:hypothetical protein
LVAGEDFSIDKIVALHGLRGYTRDGTRKHWAGEGEGVELAALAAGIDGCGQVGEQRGIEGATGEGCVEHARVDAGEVGAQAGGEHLLREFGGGDAEVRRPDGEDGFEAGVGELRDAVGANVLEEEVAEGDAVDALGDGAGEDLGHARLVVRVRAREGKVDLPERQAGGGGLLVKQLLAEAVDGDAAVLLVDGGEQANDFILGLPAEQVKGPGAVLAAAPTEEDGVRCGAGWIDVHEALPPHPFKF